MSTISTMRRQTIPKFGHAGVFEWQEVKKPVLGPREVLIEVHFAGINYADIMARRGFYQWAGKPPICPGFEVSGVVAERGAEVKIPMGAEVLAFTRFNGYAEYLVAEEDRTFLLPDGMTLEEGAALPAVYATAYHALHEVMRVRKGDSILIQAVAGGVGIAALQLAKHAGLTTYGTASTAEKLEFAKEHGLDHGINYSEDDFEKAIERLTGGRGVRFVLDSLGGNGFRKGYRSLSSPGHAVIIGAANVVPSQGLKPRDWLRVTSDMVRGGIFHPFSLVVDNRGVSGMQILLLWDELEYLSGLAEALLRLYEEGAIRPFVHRIFPMSNVAEAHSFMEERKSHGKLLLATRSASYGAG